jgi:putative polyketide hydroxylase
VASYVIGDPGLTEHNNAFCDQYEISDEGAVLVRPDGYVAWRCPTRRTDDVTLTRVLEQVLRRHR